jgi:hypothetical protein
MHGASLPMKAIELIVCSAVLLFINLFINQDKCRSTNKQEKQQASKQAQRRCN